MHDIWVRGHPGEQAELFNAYFAGWEEDVAEVANGSLEKINT
jgi:hypothetical protein